MAAQPMPVQGETPTAPTLDGECLGSGLGKLAATRLKVAEALGHPGG